MPAMLQEHAVLRLRLDLGNGGAYRLTPTTWVQKTRYLDIYNYSATEATRSDLCKTPRVAPTVCTKHCVAFATRPAIIVIFSSQFQLCPVSVAVTVGPFIVHVLMGEEKSGSHPFSREHVPCRSCLSGLDRVTRRVPITFTPLNANVMLTVLLEPGAEPSKQTRSRSGWRRGTATATPRRTWPP